MTTRRSSRRRFARRRSTASCVRGDREARDRLPRRPPQRPQRSPHRKCWAGPGSACKYASMFALAWLARVGASPTTTCVACKKHGSCIVSRCDAGDGSLIVVTRRGALEAGYPASRAPRSVSLRRGRTHTGACGRAHGSRSADLRGSASETSSPTTSGASTCATLDHRGTVRVTHRPDLVVQIIPGPVVIEVELQRKNLARLRGILRLRRIDRGRGTAGRPHLHHRTRRHRPTRRPRRRRRVDPRPGAQFRTLEQVIETRDGARAAR